VTLCRLAQGFLLSDFSPDVGGIGENANMLKEEKARVVKNLVEDLSRSSIVIATNYQGLPAKQMAELRSSLARAGISYHVVKNTLVYRAAEQVGKPQLKGLVEGPIALAFGYDDTVAAVKAFNQFIKSMSLNLQIRGGLLGDRVLQPEELVSLASLPPKEVLIAKLLGQLQAPLSSLHNALSFPLRGLVTVLQSRVQAISK